MKPIKTALVSVFNKEGLEPLARALHKNGIEIYSTGGTLKFIEDLGLKVNSIEDYTGFSSILDGRVKTLHPKIFGGILSRSNNSKDHKELTELNIKVFDLVVVDLYPFQQTVENGKSKQEIIEKIDIGGISLIRAAAKNHEDCLVCASKEQYKKTLSIIQRKASSIEERTQAAIHAFEISSDYDSAILNYLKNTQSNSNTSLRYGENPHQQAHFKGALSEIFEQLSGKALSYNNLLDIDAALDLLKDLDNQEPTCIVLKHNNACGLAQRPTSLMAYQDALAADPISAFGGVIALNKTVDLQTAQELHKLFFEVLIAPEFDGQALELLMQKSKRVLLRLKAYPSKKTQIRTVLNGTLVQAFNNKTVEKSELILKTHKEASATQIEDLLFANKIVKHTKSNTIVLVKNKQLLASGTGQTSRVDALCQAIEKAKRFNFDLKDAVMASDAFFPFPDCVEIAHKQGINAVIQPGGSIKDALSIEFCDAHKMAMYFTGARHFKH